MSVLVFWIVTITLEKVPVAGGDVVSVRKGAICAPARQIPEKRTEDMGFQGLRFREERDHNVSEILFFFPTMPLLPV